MNIEAGQVYKSNDPKRPRHIQVYSADHVANGDPVSGRVQVYTATRGLTGEWNIAYRARVVFIDAALLTDTSRKGFTRVQS